MEGSIKCSYNLRRLPIVIGRCGSHSHRVDLECDCIRGHHTSDSRSIADYWGDTGNMRMVRYET
jgi:hypothetical protein